jgi:ribonuclease P protein component
MDGARLTRRARITRAADFEAVFADSIRCSGGGLVVLACHNGLGFSRLGLAVSRRAIRRAVDRNRIKRLIRESFRLNRERLGPMDYVVLAKPGLEKQDNRRIYHTLERHWQEINARCNGC